MTKRNIDALAPGADRYAAWDTDVSRFGVRVSPSGEKAYGVKYRAGGRQRWFTFGRHGSPWTPEAARKEALRLLGEVARGLDPAEKRNADRKAMSFAEVGDLYFAEGVAHKKPSTLHVDRGRFELHLRPLLGGEARRRRHTRRHRAAAQRRDEGRTAASAPKKRRPGSIAKGGAGVAAQCVRLASAISSVRRRSRHPLRQPLSRSEVSPVRKMQRFLSEAELGRLAGASNREIETGGNPFPVAAICLLALTGARRSEVIQLRWRNVDVERGFLLLDDSKTREKVIHLSPPAIAILVNLPRVAENEFVIAGGKAGRPFVGIDKIWDRIRLSAGVTDVRLHDLRQHMHRSAPARLWASRSSASCSVTLRRRRPRVTLISPPTRCARPPTRSASRSRLQWRAARARTSFRFAAKAGGR